MGAIIFKGNFRVSGQFSREQFSSEAIVRGERCVFWGGNFPKRQLPLGVIVSRQLSGGQFSSGGNCPNTGQDIYSEAAARFLKTRNVLISSCSNTTIAKSSILFVKLLNFV